MQNDMFACGSAGLPGSIVCDQRPFDLETVFKHDFFACTGLYSCRQTGERVVLKISRIRPLWGIPLKWLGHRLRNREARLLWLLRDVAPIPRMVTEFGSNGLIYRYIEGESLDERPVVPDLFFDELQVLLREIHSREICYMDLNKRGNIIVGTDGHPYIIDFQIALHLPGTWLGFLRNAFQKEDWYHFLKQKRRFRPDLTTGDEYARSRRRSLLIKIHRAVSFPFRQVRRWLLAQLYRRNILQVQSTGPRTPENDPTRFVKPKERAQRNTC